MFQGRRILKDNSSNRYEKHQTNLRQYFSCQIFQGKLYFLPYPFVLQPKLPENESKCEMSKEDEYYESFIDASA